jgi:leucyl-tRNA synthetase
MNTAISAMMECLNTLYNEKVSQVTVEKLLKLLNPFAPHLCEELWQRLGHKKTISYEPLPSFDAALLIDDEATVVIQVNGKKRGLVSVPLDIDDNSLKQAVMTEMQESQYPLEDGDKFITVRDKKSKKPKLVNVIMKR